MAATRQQKGQDTATRILDVAERLVQVRGFNGFSYADVAAELEITKASLHYHFAGKAELGEALIERYAARFSEALTQIETSPIDAPAKLDAYAKLYADVLRAKRMCLCGMLAAEYRTLPKPMQNAVIRFFDENEAWLEAVLVQGQEEGTLAVRGIAERSGADDRQRARRRHARLASVRGPDTIPVDRGPPLRRASPARPPLLSSPGPAEAQNFPKRSLSGSKNPPAGRACACQWSGILLRSGSTQ